jgi:intraflagellar transport protein 88
MIASCYRRAGNYHRALETYKSVHRRFPENVECLKFLVKLSSDMGLKEASDYALELKKAERSRDMADQRAMSSRPGSRRSSSRNSARTGSAVSATHSPGDSRTPSRSGGGGAGAVNRLALDEETTYAPASKEIDTSYADPLGPMPERPRTSAGVRGGREEEFEDEEIGDDLLPE